MESLTIWWISVLAAAVCGLLFSYDLDCSMFFKSIRYMAFIVSLVASIIAASTKNPGVPISGAIAIDIVLIIGVVMMTGAACLANTARMSEERVLYLPAIILAIIGTAATYPGWAFELFRLTV